MDIIAQAGSVDLVHSLHGFGHSFPTRRFGLRMPSGIIHPFETAEQARESQYWPRLPGALLPKEQWIDYVLGD